MRMAKQACLRAENGDWYTQKRTWQRPHKVICKDAYARQPCGSVAGELQARKQSRVAEQAWGGKELTPVVGCIPLPLEKKGKRGRRPSVQWSGLLWASGWIDGGPFNDHVLLDM